jgi:DNA-binding response OmpR family regulator
MGKITLLVADDEPDLLAELKPLLQRSGYEVITAVDGADALARVDAHQPALIILDLLMPRLDGREVVRRLREQGDWTPVILLTQVDMASERVLSLQEGADDYLNKPFDPLELLARIRAVLRRTQGAIGTSHARWLVCQSLKVDRQTRQTLLDNRIIPLTGRAFDLLVYLMLHAPNVIEREQLLDEIWGWRYAVTTRAVDIRIAEIRKALMDDAGQPRFIETVVGQGYRFLGEVKGVS